MVRDSHSHAEIESESARCERSSESGHAAHVFRNRNRIRVNLFRKHGSEGKVGHGILVDTVIEIIVITDEVLAETVVPVQHAGHAVEPEAVKMVFFHPELTVREQEVFGFGFSVVEASGAPCRMMPLAALIEIKVFPPVEKAEAFRLIFNTMRMHDIHNHGNSA